MPKNKKSRPSQKDRKRSTVVEAPVSGKLDGGTPLILSGASTSLLDSALKLASGVSSDAAAMIQDVETHINSPNVKINARIKKSSTMSMTTKTTQHNITTGEKKSFQASNVQHQEMEQTWSSGPARGATNIQSAEMHQQSNFRRDTEIESPTKTVKIPIGVVESPMSPPKDLDCETFPYSAQQSMEENSKVYIVAADDSNNENEEIIAVESPSEENISKIYLVTSNDTTENMDVEKVATSNKSSGGDGKSGRRPSKLNIAPIIITETEDNQDEEAIVKTPTVKQRRKSTDNTVFKVLESGTFGGYNINNLVHEVQNKSTKESLHEKISKEARKKSAAFLSPDDVQELYLQQQRDRDEAMEIDIKDDLSQEEFNKILNEYKSELGIEESEKEVNKKNQENKTVVSSASSKISESSIQHTSEKKQSVSVQETTQVTKSVHSSFKSVHSTSSTGMKKEESIRKESKMEPLRIVELKKADDVLSFTKAVIDKARRASTSHSSSSGSSREDVSKITGSSEKHVSYNETAEHSSEQKVDGKIYLMSQSSEQDEVPSLPSLSLSRMTSSAFDSMMVEPGSPTSTSRGVESRMSLATIPDVFRDRSLLNVTNDLEYLLGFLSGVEVYSHPVTMSSIPDNNFELSHYLDIKKLSASQIATIKVMVIVDQYTSETYDVVEVKTTNVIFRCPNLEHQFRDITLLVVSELERLPVHAQIFPVVSNTLAIGVSVGNPKHLARYLNKKLRKCGYEKQITIQKGASVVITNHATSTTWTIPFSAHQEFSFSGNSEYLLPTRDFMDVSIMQNEKVVTSSTVSFYNLERLKKEISAFRMKPESWAVMPFSESYPDMDIKGWSSNLEPLYHLARSSRLTTKQFKALLKHLEIENQDLDNSSMITALKTAISNWKAEKGVLGNLDQLTSILQLAEVALSTAAQEILQNVANTRLGIHFFG